MLEDTPDHVYFMLATTDPQKLLSTIKTRATEIKVRSLKSPDMKKLLGLICEKEDIELSSDVLDKLVDHAGGSPRKALVLLNQVIGHDDEDEQLKAIEAGDSMSEAIEVAKALVTPGTTWNQMAKILKKIDKDQDAEGLRYLVLAYCTTVLLGGGKQVPRAYQIIMSFSESFYYTKKAGLAAACYEVIVG